MLSIREIQGDAVESPYGGQQVTTGGVVTGQVRRGFFIQTANKPWDGRGSDGIFIYSPDARATVGTEVEVQGECLDYVKHDNARPTTQIHLSAMRVLDAQAPQIPALTFSAAQLAQDNQALAKLLNSLEGMLVAIPANSTFIAPSNKYGDYVLALPEQYAESGVVSTEHKGVIVESFNPLRWFPGFRVTAYQYAQKLNVGARLLKPVSGPLNYRVGSYQVAVSHDLEVAPSAVELTKSTLTDSEGALTVMTLNCFNLDPHLESKDKVLNPRQDVDDDWGEGRFHTLAQAVVAQANLPDIVALQEIQDNDGAEITDIVDANETYEKLIRTIEKVGGLRYQWVDVNPELGEDGGQPGGNIRNGYLYNPNRVALVDGSVKTLGKDESCFEDSRKSLVCTFAEKNSGKHLVLINVHLASKRHQNSIFAPSEPGVDAKLGIRSEQAQLIKQETKRLDKLGIEYYVTGDFNDGENSEPLKVLVGDESANLVFTLAENERYDYNHRGKLQVLMHGIVPKRMVEQGRAQYEILHGNELIGVTPGKDSDKPSDHAYVIAKLYLG